MEFVMMATFLSLDTLFHTKTLSIEIIHVQHSIIGMVQNSHLKLVLGLSDTITGMALVTLNGSSLVRSGYTLCVVISICGHGMAIDMFFFASFNLCNSSIHAIKYLLSTMKICFRDVHIWGWSLSRVLIRVAFILIVVVVL